MAGHPAAKRYLSEAQAKAGGLGDLSLPTAKSAEESSRLLLLGVPPVSMIKASRAMASEQHVVSNIEG
jgi:hypothetical protein